MIKNFNRRLLHLSGTSTLMSSRMPTPPSVPKQSSRPKPMPSSSSKTMTRRITRSSLPKATSSNLVAKTPSFLASALVKQSSTETSKGRRSSRVTSTQPTRPILVINLTTCSRGSRPLKLPNRLTKTRRSKSTQRSWLTAPLAAYSRRMVPRAGQARI